MIYSPPFVVTMFNPAFKVIRLSSVTRRNLFWEVAVVAPPVLPCHDVWVEGHLHAWSLVTIHDACKTGGLEVTCSKQNAVAVSNWLTES